MRFRHIAGVLFVAVVAFAGCGGSDESANSPDGSAGSGASAGSGGGSAGSSTGGGSGTGTGGAGQDGGGGTSGTGTGGAGTGGTGTGGTGACVPAKCQGKLYACGDCIDNDNDGKVDMEDPDCLGPCHNAENTYYGSIPGQAGPACTVDCYFDQDSGSGNDDCHWNHECDPLSVAPNYPPEGPGSTCAYDPNANTPGTSQSCTQLMDKQSNACLSFCGDLTPNGCDCFGCCNLPAGGNQWVWLGSEKSGVGSCTLKDVNDPTKCQPCTPVKGCLNTCEKCELCLGKTELPPECSPPPPDAGTGGSGTGGTGGTGGSGTGGTAGSGGSCGGQICPVGKQPCGLSCQPACPSGQFCLTGCCTAVPT